MEKKISLIVGEEDQNTRVDTFINKHNKEISRTRIKNLILDKNLKINNQIVEDPSKKLLLNDNVFIQVPEPKKTSLKPFKYNLNIIYEDDDLMVINKPAGIVMHPGAGNYDNTIVNALISYDKKLSTSIGDELRPGIVHRIDKNTSGLVVIAKNNPTHENLSNQFNKHTILRSYQLLIWGKLRPSVGRIETFITRSSKNRQMMEASQTKGKKQ
jgi:23S rRNA pseudouridine1911/1915/1917 synthase